MFALLGVVGHISERVQGQGGGSVVGGDGISGRGVSSKRTKGRGSNTKALGSHFRGGSRILVGEPSGVLTPGGPEPKICSK